MHGRAAESYSNVSACGSTATPASKDKDTSTMARTHLDISASSPQIRRVADSLYYRQYAFLKLPSHEVQKIADIKDTLSSSEPVLERQGLQHFPERVVRHFKPGERQGFLSVSQQPAWLEYLPLAEAVPPCKLEEGCALHHDRGLLTLMWSSTVEGLQVVNTRTSQIEDVLLPQGYILVLPGYTLQRATCGIYKAAAHRVTMRDVEGGRFAVAFKLRSPDTALLDFHTALTAAGKRVEPRFNGPIRVIELLALFDEMHPSSHDADSRQGSKVLTPRQAASTDPVRGPSWKPLAPRPDAPQVHAQADTASSNAISQKPLDSLFAFMQSMNDLNKDIAGMVQTVNDKAAVQTACSNMVPRVDSAEPIRGCDKAESGASLQVASTGPVQARAAVDEGLPLGRCSQAGPTALAGGQVLPAPGLSSLNHLAAPWDPILGFSKASPHQHSSANAHTAPIHGLLRSGARAVSSHLGCAHIMPQPHNNVAAGGDLDTSESGMSDDDEVESAAHLRVRRNGARAMSPPSGCEHIMPQPHNSVASGGDLDSDGDLDNEEEHAADPGGQPDRPRLHISERGKRRSKARALRKKKARREARLLREQQMQPADT
ncbi:TPA: hypothetical protein ACH3X2_003572 [Trebouxia sp. C0005]